MSFVDIPVRTTSDLNSPADINQLMANDIALQSDIATKSPVTTPLFKNSYSQTDNRAGGMIQLEKSAAASADGHTQLDVFNRIFRVFEGGTPYRGVYVDLSTKNTGSGSRLLTENDISGVTSGFVSNIHNPMFHGRLEDTSSAAKQNYEPVITTDFSRYFTLTTNNIVAQFAGYYRVTAQQLIINSTLNTYFAIRKNNAVVTNGYTGISTAHLDIFASVIVRLEVGDWVDVAYTGGVVLAWGSVHSDIAISYIG